MFLIGPYSYPPGTMLSALQRLGLTTNLKVCLDAGDINSYDGTSQTWTDVSGGGYSFYRGSGSGSDAADPTFNGTAGHQTSGEFFSFDGGDNFTLAQANPTWVNNLHKDGAKVSCACWLYLATVAGGNPIFGTSVNSSIIGAGFFISNSGTAAWNATNGSANSYIDGGSDVISAGAWAFAAFSLDENANSATFIINGSSTTKSGAYSSPTASNTAKTLAIAKLSGVPDGFILSGGRMANIAIWEGVALTQTDLNAIYLASKTRFGL